MDDSTPPKKSDLFCFRCVEEEKAEFMEAAEREGRTASNWARYHLKQAARKTH